MLSITCWCDSSFIPRLDKRNAASASAFQPSISSNLIWSSPTLSASASEKFSFAYKSSICFLISKSSLFPKITVSNTLLRSYRLWSCSNTDSLFPDSNDIDPELPSFCLDKIFKNVDLPAPLAPIIP